mmetsp:Transcript_1192/g.3583  ORF Transcript_1192/g.3583 Transcript_1192/m.3583 type:complete len:216 (-) Transcript_1192:73-720(-)
MRSPGAKAAGSSGAEGASKGPGASSAPPGTEASIGWAGGASVAPVGWPALWRRRARAARCFRASGPGGPLSGWPQCSFTSREKRSQSPRVFRHGPSKDQVVRQRAHWTSPDSVATSWRLRPKSPSSSRFLTTSPGPQSERTRPSSRAWTQSRSESFLEKLVASKPQTGSTQRSAGFAATSSPHTVNSSTSPLSRRRCATPFSVGSSLDVSRRTSP